MQRGFLSVSVTVGKGIRPNNGCGIRLFGVLLFSGLGAAVPAQGFIHVDLDAAAGQSVLQGGHSQRCRLIFSLAAMETAKPAASPVRTQAGINRATSQPRPVAETIPSGCGNVGDLGIDEAAVWELVYFGRNFQRVDHAAD